MDETPSPSAKKPCKGILKTSSSFDKPSSRKSAKFDEINVMQTYHPIDKDYGHMKIEEPKTPYNYVDNENADQLDAELLAEKLYIAAKTQNSSDTDDADNASDDETPEDDMEQSRRTEFERRRRAHYNEFEAVRLARKLIAEEDTDETDDDEAAVGAAAAVAASTVAASVQGDATAEKTTGTKVVQHSTDGAADNCNTTQIVAAAAVAAVAAAAAASAVPVPATNSNNDIEDCIFRAVARDMDIDSDYMPNASNEHQ